jgi:hypothetical protein
MIVIVVIYKNKHILNNSDWILLCKKIITWEKKGEISSVAIFEVKRGG